MTFLEALNWMSEGNNVALRDGRIGTAPTAYKMKYGSLFRLDGANQWVPADDSFSANSEYEWSKSEPTPEVVEVVAYTSETGAVIFSTTGSEDEKRHRESHWRKVKVRFV